MEKNTTATAGARSPQQGPTDVRRRAMVALLCVAVLAIGVWVYGRIDSGSSSSASSAPSPSSELASSAASPEAPSAAEVLEAEARAFAASTVSQDWDTAYGYMTVECQASKTRAEFETDVEVGMKMAETMGLDLTRIVITDVQVRDVTDTQGEVLTTGEVDGAQLTDQEVWDAWVFQEGSWRSTDCPENMGSGATDDAVIASDPAAG